MAPRPRRYTPPFPTIIFNSAYRSLGDSSPSLDPACTTELQGPFNPHSRVAQWQEQFLNKLVAQIPMPIPPIIHYNAKAMIARNFIPAQTQIHPFLLATSVFECGRCRKALHGFDAISDHLHCPAPHDTMSFSTSGATAVETLLKLLNMDPVTTLTGELDKLDHRFMCANCPVHATGRRGVRGRYALRWRECVRPP